MDFLSIVVVLAVWGIATFAKQAQKAAKQARKDAVPEAAGDASQPLRPADIDLPGQASLPIHWDGTHQSQAPRTIPAPDPAMRPFYTNVPTNDRLVLPEQQQGETVTVDIPGLDLQFDGDTLVKGVIFSEILTRRTDRRPR